MKDFGDGVKEQGVFRHGWVSERLERAIKAIATDVDGAEALFRGDEAQHLRLGDARITEASSVEEGKVTVRAVVNGSAARTTTSDLSDAGLDRCARQARDRARQTPLRAGQTPVVLPRPRPLMAAPDWSRDEGTATLGAETKRTWLSEGLRAHRADDFSLAGCFHTGRMTVAVQSTEGINAFHAGSYCDLSLSALEYPAGHRASAYRGLMTASVGQDVVDKMQREVREECHRAHDPRELSVGAWDVVLAPAAVADLLQWLSLIAFGSRAAEDGLSFVTSRRDEQVMNSAVSIMDAASMPSGIGVPMPFDIEGLPKEEVPLVDAGIARRTVYDSVSAGVAGCHSTGHAVLDDLGGAAGGMAMHVHMAGGEATVDDLIGQVDRGIFITRFHYVNGMIEPRRAVMTGLLRDGAFLIEKGRLGRAVRSFRFTDSILEAFSRIPGSTGISREQQAHSAWFGLYTCMVAPYVLVPGLKFTSGR